MLKLLLLICLFIAVLAGWKIGKKIQKNEHFRLKWQKKAKKHAALSALSSSEEPREERIEYVDSFELQLFDDVAQLFFEQKLHETRQNMAEDIQTGVLRKMPAKTVTQIRKMDLNEWSVYWNFYEQSLEYYVGRYGVFCTHVDRNGDEHKQEFRRDS